MNRKYIAIVISLLLTLLIAFFVAQQLFTPKHVTKEADKLSEELVASTTSGLSPLVSLPYAFGVAYPSKYYVSALEYDASTTPHLAVVMILDTQENRDLLAGKSTTARDGGVGMTINVYQNPSRLSPETWAQKDTNWGVSDKKIATTTLAGEEGVLFRWSGLYEGASIILAHGDFAYVFAVSWESEGDPILTDFDQILASLRFLERNTSIQE